MRQQVGILIEIDEDAGFCSGVSKAIAKAEELLNGNRKVFAIGDIVHNDFERERLATAGLKVIGHDDIESLPEGAIVILRAHGEPPATYERLKAAGIDYIDATCPIVLRLQDEVRKVPDAGDDKSTVIVFGEPEHPEAVSLRGQNEAKVRVTLNASEIDPTRIGSEVFVCSQTTRSKSEYFAFAENLRVLLARGGWSGHIRVKESVCRQVSNRADSLCRFSRKHDVVLFVSGRDSSNGKTLFKVISDVNTRAYMVNSSADIREEWLAGARSIGISGATSTPESQLQSAARRVRELIHA